MPLEIVTVPCLKDNYAYLLRDAATGTVGLVDAPEAAAVEAALKGKGWALDLILITHHHGDHIDGVEALRKAHGAKVAGAAADRRRLPKLDIALAEGDTVAIGESVGAGARRAGPYGRAHRLLVRGGPCALLGGQPDGDGVRPAVRGNARADVGEPDEDGGAAGRDAGVFRPRVRGKQHPLRTLGRSGKRRAPPAGERDCCDAAEWSVRRCRRGSTSNGRRTRSCGSGMAISRPGLGWKDCRMPKFSPRSAGGRTLSEQVQQDRSHLPVITAIFLRFRPAQRIISLEALWLEPKFNG